MFYGNNVQDTRKLFYVSWQKYLANQLLSPLENELVDVIKLHPEYHSLLLNEHNQTTTYFPEMGQSNPFLHMGLHLAIREQVATNRPQGITPIYQRLEKNLSIIDIEHKMMECLADILWQAQRNHQPPNEEKYLELLNKL